MIKQRNSTSSLVFTAGVGKINKKEICNLYWLFFLKEGKYPMAYLLDSLSSEASASKTVSTLKCYFNLYIYKYPKPHLKGIMKNLVKLIDYLTISLNSVILEKF